MFIEHHPIQLTIHSRYAWRSQPFSFFPFRFSLSLFISPLSPCYVSLIFVNRHTFRLCLLNASRASSSQTVLKSFVPAFTVVSGQCWSMSSLPLLTNREISTLSQSPESTAATEVSVDEQTEASDVLALESSLQSKDRLRSIALQRLTEVRSANKELQRDKEMLMKDKHQYLTTIAELRATIRALQIGSNSDQRARNIVAPEASNQLTSSKSTSHPTSNQPCLRNSMEWIDFHPYQTGYIQFGSTWESPRQKKVTSLILQLLSSLELHWTGGKV